MIELLAPAGNSEKLKTAIYYGADAVYLAGKSYGLRSYCDNFTDDELAAAVQFCHSSGKKVYVTMNIYAYDSDLPAMGEYAKFLSGIGVDAVLVSDPGVIETVKVSAPELQIHLSTQANTTNSAAAKFWERMGVSRIVLAREVGLDGIRRMRDALQPKTEIEAFVHGAMCVAYSGRCLLSAVTANRSGNRGECAQSCRWEYALAEKTRQGEYFPVSQDGRGTYILNSKDLNMLSHINELIEAGVTSLKIEGRAKTSYYLATVVNAYRRAINEYQRAPANFKLSEVLEAEPYKTSHRKFNTGFYYGQAEQCLRTAKPEQSYEMCAIVKSYDSGKAVIEQRNRFKAGDELEILSPSDSFLKMITVGTMLNENGEEVTDAKLVQQNLVLQTEIPLQSGDILRKKL